jgi:phosphoglycerol transferase MdoB-like AlkP superfamily enzyme
LVFLLFNNSHFPLVYFTDFLAGFWFDLVTTSIIFLPLFFFELLPNKARDKKIFQIILATIFFLLIASSVFLNLADVEYYKFTSSRLTSSTFTMLAYGNDFQQQLPSFISSYWYLFLIAIVLLFIAGFLYKRIQRITDDSKETSWLKQIIIFPIILGLLLLIGRGTGLRPIEPINVTAYTIDQNVPLVLNSAFTVVKSWGKTTLKEKDYFTEDELTQIFNPIKQYNSTARYNKPNIVILMLESFSVEYIAGINGSNEVNTPFLDSLIEESLVYTNCYANGKKSIDAVPSVISSVPKLMNQEFITSNYSTNKVESIPKHLNKLGYETAFFHGASNGSMNFDQFASKVDFNNYYGRTEYNNDKDFDGTWGIYDEDFFKWSAQKMTNTSEPFFSTIFSLSSHPPYAIPEKYEGKFIGGKTDMHNSVKYTDFAIQQFFDYAKTQPWYNNTLFVITADHTPASGLPEYYSDMGNMHIPLIFFHPTDSTLKGKSKKIVAQVDIMPTLFDLIGYHQPFYSFGQSVFENNEGLSMVYHNNKYLIFGKNHLFTFQNDKALGLYDLSDRTLTINRLEQKPEITIYLEKMIKAFVQTYHKHLINNKMTAE